MSAQLVENIGRFTHFAWRVLWVLPGTLLLRSRETLSQLYHICVGALPLGLAGGAAVGAVISIHGHNLLNTLHVREKFILPQLLSAVMIVELAPIIAGLIAAGRSGANLSAEIGSMRLTEQLDALEMLGL